MGLASCLHPGKVKYVSIKKNIWNLDSMTNMRIMYLFKYESTLQAKNINYLVVISISDEENNFQFGLNHDVYTISYYDFIMKALKWDPLVTDPIFNGELLEGDNFYLNMLKGRIKQTCTDIDMIDTLMKGSDLCLG